MKALPINDNEVYVRCPSCGLIGWTVDDDTRPLPMCPKCDVRSVDMGKDGAALDGFFDVRVIDGAPTDPSHDLSNVDV